MKGERITFTNGKLYRRRAIHRKYGGQERGGISTPRRHPVILLFSGDPGRQYGDVDRFHKDGTFSYTGDGQLADMELVRGNRAIAESRSEGKILHLFLTVGSGWVL